MRASFQDLIPAYKSIGKAVIPVGDLLLSAWSPLAFIEYQQICIAWFTSRYMVADDSWPQILN